MPINFYMYFVAAIIPMLVGAAYYHPKSIGGPWMKVNNFTEESLQGANMAVIFGVSYLLSLMLSFSFGNMVIHQSNVFSMMMPDVLESGNEAQKHFSDLMAIYGDRYRTFSHGVAHGILTSIFFVLPIVGIIALFERRGWKYIFIHVGYWAITLALIGGILCSTLEYATLS